MTTTASFDASPRGPQTFPAAEEERCPKTTSLLQLLQARRWDDARAAGLALAMERPKDPLPHKAIGAAAFHTGRRADAIAHFRMALELQPTEAESRVNLIKALAQCGADKQAVQALLRAADSGGEKLSADNLYQEATILAAAAEPAAARARLLEASALEPKEWRHAELYARIAYFYPAAETSFEGVRMLMRMLIDPRVENRGAQLCAGRTLMRELERGRAAAENGEARVPAKWFTPLMIALLGNALSTDPRLEPILIGLRADLLRRVAAAPEAALERESLDLAEAFARHSFRNEFIWPETEEETALLEPLKEHINAALGTVTPVSAPALYMLGAYRDLSGVDTVSAWVSAVEAHAPDTLDPTLRLLVLEPLQEKALAETVTSLTPIDEGVSSAVREQYEANPYPRWSALHAETPRHYLEHIAGQPYPLLSDLTPTADAPKVLIAGCGTGRQPIASARRFKDSQVLGVDLSRASLAYATRQARRMGVNNIAFAQADIMRLEGVDETFDVIESSGVLHHLENPEAGLRRLIAALKPGGFMNIGLYSRLARQHISQARSVISEQGYAADEEGLRRFRQDVFAGKLPALRGLAQIQDFYSASNLRDLVFHVQEHQFDLQQLKAMLERNGLEFLRFAHLSPNVMRDYQAAFPQDPRMTDLQCWAEFEERHPSAFSAMYQFWCRKI